MAEISINLIDGPLSEEAEEALKEFYEPGLIVAEKKPFLSDLRKSTGPFLATSDGKFILDSCSQIASLGLGYNGSAQFGVGHQLESWINRADTENSKNLRVAFLEFLKRKTGWKDLNLFFANSGAEANEIALGDCYKRRRFKDAKKILAFEGSFHGRMLVSLSATWNKKKREPFEMPGIESLFVPIKEIEAGPRAEPSTPENWQAIWEQAPKNRFKELLQQFSGQDDYIDSEIESLLAVREAILSKEIYAVIIEPKQCEGGENYISARFHNGLINLTKSFSIPLVYDEVQNGFGLGGSFFWHKTFNLQDGRGDELHPDYVVCAKKSQVGIVLSHQAIEYEEQCSIASMHRGYVQGMVLDQYEGQIDKISQTVSEHLETLCKKHASIVENPRNKGLAFAFDFKDKDHLAKLVAKRFDHGMLLYGAGERTARFRLNLAYRPNVIAFLFNILDKILDEISNSKESTKEPLQYTTKRISPESQYSFHQRIIQLKHELLTRDGPPKDKEIHNILNDVLSYYLGDDAKDISISFIDSSNYNKYRDRIIELEDIVYEPQRRTPIKEFDVAVEAPRGVALAVEYKGEAVGVAFGAPLQRYPFHRGVRRDPHFEDLSAVYMIAVTVHNDFQGMSLGRVLKFGFSLLALRNGVRFIEGRTRDRLARGMLSINLALGAYEILHMYEEYQDDEPYRDVVYYSIPLAWEEPPLNLSSAIISPLNLKDLSKEFLDKGLPSVVNKISLGNFVNQRYLDNLKNFSEFLPNSLKHLYAASGQSECVEKIVKALWRKNSPKSKFLTFEGMYFGHGSFLSRALSEETGECREGFDSHYFDVTRLPFPEPAKQSQLLKEVEQSLKSGEYLALFIEPRAQLTMKKVELDFLKKLKELCRKYETALVVNDTGALFSRYDAGSFLASRMLKPDCGFSFLGGQMGICYVSDEIFLRDPLMLISTWDGDEHSLACFSEAAKSFEESSKIRIENRKKFNNFLTALLEDCGIEDYNLEDGFGSFKGEIPQPFKSYFKKVKDRYLVLPEDGEIARVLKELES